MPSVTVSSVTGKKYQQKITNGNHTVLADVSTTSGGDDSGLDPKQLALGALGACTAMTIISRASKILPATNKPRWDVQTVKVTVTETKQADPADATKKISVITEDIEVTGGNLTQQELDDIKATAKQCPVYQLFMGDKQIDCVVTKK